MRSRLCANLALAPRRAAHRGNGGTPEGLPEYNPGKQLVAPD
jgi:hypothetical protein